MSNLAEVISLYDTNASDIAAMLRQAADSIELEEAEGFQRTRCIVAVQITEDRHIKVYGWGKTDITDSIGVLTVGASYLTNTLFNAQDEHENP